VGRETKVDLLMKILAARVVHETESHGVAGTAKRTLRSYRDDMSASSAHHSEVMAKRLNAATCIPRRPYASTSIVITTVP
jgi:hypothetical protein